MKAPMLHWPETLLGCCPHADGAAAAVLCSEEFVNKHGLEAQAVEINSMSMKTDTPQTFKGSAADMVGCNLTKLAAKEVYQKSGITPDQVDVCELHDCFTSNELVSYEYLGLC